MPRWDSTLFAPLSAGADADDDDPYQSSSANVSHDSPHQAFVAGAGEDADTAKDAGTNPAPALETQTPETQTPAPAPAPSNWAPMTGFWSDKRLSPTEFWFLLFGFFVLLGAVAGFLYVLYNGASDTALVPIAPVPATFVPPDWLSNPNACGPSALPCDVTGGQVCQNGTCVCGTAGFFYCPGTGCVSLVSVSSCGGCGISCAPGQICMWDAAQGRARCVCPPGQQFCGGSCVSTTNPFHCGQCNVGCGPGFACAMTVVTLANGSTTLAPGCTFQGSASSCGPNQLDCATLGPYGACVYDPSIQAYTCQNLLSSTQNCGIQGRACAPGEQCINGECAATDRVDSCGTGAVNCFLAIPGALSPQCCAGACVDISTNLTFCGGCSRLAPCAGPGATCVVNEDAAVSDPGLPVPSPYRCSAPDSDRYNCGASGFNCAGIFGDGGRCVAGSCINTLDSTLACASMITLPTVACGVGERCCAGQCRNISNNTLACGSCGTTCPTGSTCVSGACVLQSAVAGGQCGSLVCAGDEYCCGADNCQKLFANNPSNCGGCGFPCTGTGFTCVSGVCYNTLSDPNACGGVGPAFACALGEACCGGTCRNVTTDVTYCGGCVALLPTQTAGKHCCGGSMFLNTDPVNCGTNGCGLNCATLGKSCCLAGASTYCADLATEVSNCGTCGVVCPPGFLCCGGNCVSPTSISACGGCTLKCNGGVEQGPGVKAACIKIGASLPFCANLAADPLHCNGTGLACAVTQICVPTLVLGVTAGTCVARFASASTNTITAGLNPVTFFVGLQALLLAAIAPGQVRMPNGLGYDPLQTPFACGGYNIWCREANPQCINGFCRCSTNPALARCAPGFLCVDNGFGVSECRPAAYLCPGQYLCPDPYAGNGAGWTCAPSVFTTTTYPMSTLHCAQCGLRCAAGQTCTLKLISPGVSRPSCTCTTHTQCPPGHYCMKAAVGDPNTSSSCQPLP